MRMSDNIARLRRMKAPAAPFAAGEDRLTDIAGFGPNPGGLRARLYIPPGMVASAPLVVVLHGCTQTAAGYDQGSGWSRLADRCGFALLYPEQQRANNPNLCFNWFQSSDTRRDEGEAASIRQMVDHVVATHAIDPARVFVTGLSAGGAMASVMLAAYPEIFAAGAVIAGVPYGCATSVGGAFECMGGGGRGSSTALGDAVRRASSHTGPWPRVSVWHGSADNTVASTNGDDIVKQWLNVHGLKAKPGAEGTIDGYPHRAWLGGDGQPLVEQYLITGMGHGTPLAPGDMEGQSGEAGPHMLDVAISSTDRIAEFFGIADDAVTVDAPAPAAAALPVLTAGKPRARRAHLEPEPTPPPAQATGVQAIIEDALRAAGLLR